MDRNCDPGCRHARTQRDERESRSSRGAEHSNGGWPVKRIPRDQGPQCLDQTQVQPALMLRQLAFAMRISRALYAAVQLGVADLLASGPMTGERLAVAAGVDGQSLRRLLRALVAYGVFEEEAPDRYCLNAAAELLRRDVPGSQRAGVLFTAGDMTWQLWSDFLESVRTGRAVVERAFGKNVFERNAENSEESALFGQAMAAFSAALSQPLIAAYDFSSFQCVADVGGGTGRLLADILAANVEVQGILFDLADVSNAAPPLLEASGVAGRCKLVAGNFFESVPAGANAGPTKRPTTRSTPTGATSTRSRSGAGMGCRTIGWMINVKPPLPSHCRHGRSITRSWDKGDFRRTPAARTILSRFAHFGEIQRPTPSCLC